MFGIVIGTLSLIGFIKVWRAGRYGYGRHHGGPRKWMLRRLFERLDTTPGQEKVILEAMNDAEAKAWAFRDAMHSSRSSFAQAFRSEHFDGARVDETFTQQQAAIDALKGSLRAGLAKVHEALNDEQRRELADLMEHGPHRFHGGWRHHGRHGRRGMGPMAQSGTVNV